jgi:hypothetical protein
VDGYEDGTITVRDSTPPNEPPLVHAGPDQVVTAGDVVTLSGTASDPENAALTYLWLQIAGPGVELSSPRSDSLTFTAPAVTSVTFFEFQFRASDGTSTRTDPVVITINPISDTGGNDDPGTNPSDPPQADPPPSGDDDDNDGGTDPTTVTPGITDPDTSTSSDDNSSTDGSTAPAGNTQGNSSPQEETAGTQPGTPACAMGIADAALFSCAGLWLMLLQPMRGRSRSERLG